MGAFLGWVLERSGFGFARVLSGGSESERHAGFAYLLALAACWVVMGAFCAGRWQALVAPRSLGLGAAVLAGLVAGPSLVVLRACPLGSVLGTGHTAVRAALILAGWTVGVLTGTHGILAPVVMAARGTGADVGGLWMGDLPSPAILLVPAVAAVGVVVWLLREPVTVSPGAMEWPKQAAGLAAACLLGWTLAIHGGEPSGLNGVVAVEDAWAGLSGGRLWLGPSLLAGVGIMGFGITGAVRRKGLFTDPVSGLTELLIVVGASFALGVSSAISGGCPAFHAFYGASVFSLGSIAFVLSAFLGARLTSRHFARSSPAGER